MDQGGGSRRRSTRSSRRENLHVDTFGDECAAEYMDRREEIRRGKFIEENSSYDVVLGAADTESDGEEDETEDDDHLSYNQALKIFRCMKIWGTKYAHQETMETLGIADDVNYMLDTCGLTTYVTRSESSYKEETCQFLASVEMNLYDEDMAELSQDAGFGYLTFLAKGQNGKLEKFGFTVKQFEELFELPPGTICDYDYASDELQALWEITAGPNEYLPSRGKSNQLRNPAIRYFHRAVANACFPRMLTGNVRQPELEMIDEGLKEILNRDCAKYGRVFKGDITESNFSSCLLDQLLSYRSWAAKLRDKKSGVICVGGIVTAILKACGAQLKSKPIPPTYMDIPYLKRIGFLEKTPKYGPNLYIFSNPETKDEDKLLLPNPELTDLRISGNIDFRPPTDALWTVHAQASVPVQPRSENEITEQEPDCYYFDDEINARWSVGVKSANKKSSLLQKWNKFQDGVIDKLVKSTRDMSSQIKEIQRALRMSSRSKQRSVSNTEPQPQPQQPTLRRTRSVSQAPRRRSTSTSVPARTSSHIPRSSMPRDMDDMPQFSVNFDPNSTPSLRRQMDIGSGSCHYGTENDHMQQIIPLRDLRLGEGEVESVRAPSHSVASDVTVPIGYNEPSYAAPGPVALDFDPHNPAYQINQPYTDTASPAPWNLYF